MTVKKPNDTRVEAHPMPADATSCSAGACARVPLGESPLKLYTVEDSIRENGSQVRLVTINQEGLKPVHWRVTLSTLLNDKTLQGRQQVDVLREEGEFTDEEVEALVNTFQLPSGQLLVGALAVQVGHRAKNGTYTVEVKDTGVPRVGTMISS